MPCTILGKCGGCALGSLSYPEQLTAKQKRCEALLGGFGKILPILGMEEPCHYRNKVHQVLARDARGQLISGYYGAGSHRVYSTPDCLLDDVKCQEIIATVRRLAGQFRLSVYDERSGRGFLRHVLVRRGFSTGEIMLVLVVTEPVFHGKQKFLTALLEAHPEITSVVLNINARRTTMVLGEKNIPLYGPAYITDRLLGLSFRLSPTAFFQINPVQTEKLYRTALDFAELTGKEQAVDAYCGIGTIGLCAAAAGAGSVIGAELNAAAVRDARVNARLNGLENVRFAAADAGKFLTEQAAAGVKTDVLFMDPPRSGSSDEFLAACLHMVPERLVYISCNPETLARDLAVLCRGAYEVRQIRPVDMFPFTDSIEAVAQLIRK